MTEDEIKALQAKAAHADALAQEVAALKNSAAVAFAEKRTASAVEFVDAHIKRGVLKPALKASVVALLAAEPAPVAFSEGGSAVTSDAGSIVRELLIAAVPPVEFGERAGGVLPQSKPGSDAEIDARARTLVKQKGITYEAALRELV